MKKHLVFFGLVCLMSFGLVGSCSSNSDTDVAPAGFGGGGSAGLGGGFSVDPGFGGSAENLGGTIWP